MNSDRLCKNFFRANRSGQFVFDRLVLSGNNGVQDVTSSWRIESHQMDIVSITTTALESYLIFVPLKGEYIASAVRRGNETLGIKGINKLDYRIRKKPRPVGKLVKSVIEYPNFLDNHEISSTVLYENTLYPLAAALGRTLATCKYTPYTQWKICLQCVISDLKTCGVAFIHRCHLIYSVTLCRKHATRLHSHCPTCLIPITSHNISNFTECSDLYSEEPNDFNSPRHHYAIFIHSLLNYKKHPFNLGEIERKIVQKMQKNGIWDGYMMGTASLIQKSKEALGIDFKFEYFYKLSMETCSAMAFLAYTSADNYFSDVSHLPTQDYL